MQDNLDISRKCETLLVLMEKHLGVRADSFGRALSRVARRMPRRVRKQATKLAQAEEMARIPKLERMIDAQDITLAYREVTDWLKGRDLAADRLTRRLNMLALLAFQLLVVAVVLGAFLRWRGLI